jgi:hypothetical protein
MDDLVFSPDLTPQDALLLRNLQNDIALEAKPLHPAVPEAAGPHARTSPQGLHDDPAGRDARDLAALKAMNDPGSSAFEPTVFSSVDLGTLKVHPMVDRLLLAPYIRWAQSIVRHPTDVVMLTHLLLYWTTSVPSALYLFYSFSWVHGVVHTAMQFSYMGAYTLLMHQHIHMRGVLAKTFPLSIVDRLFPYVTDPLMGHTWNSYYHHHVKHHHVEGNGPDDLSSTIRYQRDNVLHFLHYIARFMLLVGCELSLYFVRKRRFLMAASVAFWEFSCIGAFAFLAIRVDWRPTLFVFILPHLLMRIGLMVGNWGQHAFVDADEPDSDYRSSVTLIDVPVSLPPLT